MNISIVIPTYNREKHLLNCLNSILDQKKLPFEILVVDNAKHDKAKEVVNIVEKKFDKQNIDIFFLKNNENSGAIARNIGAFKAKGDLIAFLDDDVILDKNYYHEIEKVFLNNDRALGVQGYDTGTYLFEQKMRNSFFNQCVYKFEKIFMISSLFEDGRSRVLPSLCVTNPYPDFESIIQSEWISTCAGVFSREVLNNYNFDNQFKKYSWNEYVDFSYAIFLENPHSLFVTPHAKYHDVQTEQGRLQPKDLIYMSEVYDMYIFIKRFDMTFKNILLYVWSKFGRVIYNIIRIIVRQPKKIIMIFHCLYAPLYVLFNLNKIRKGNLDFFNDTLS
jgi:glucosyl-dolichyl phosphate glucuronosyltransferase